MNIFRTLLLLLFSSLTVISAYSKSSLTQLRQQCEEARSLSQYDALEKLSATLLLEANNQKAPGMASYAYFYNGLAKLFLGKAQQAEQQFCSADKILTETPNDTVKALILNARGISEAMINNNNFVAQTLFFKSLELAKKVNYEELQLRVRGNLLTLSHSVGDSIVIENASKVYNYGVTHKKHEQIYMGAYYLATYYYNHDNYAEAEKYLGITLEVYEQKGYDDIASVYALYSKLLLSKGEMAQAEQMARKALSLAEEYNQLSMQVDAYITIAEVLTRKKQHAEAVKMLDKAILVAVKIGMTSKLADCYRIMADNYIVMGNNTDALSCIEKTNSLLEEKAKLNMERITHELQVMHDIEQKEMEEEIRLQTITLQRRLLISLVVAVVFLLLLLVVIIVNYRHRQVLYKKIVLQNYRVVARQKELLDELTELKRLHEDTTTDIQDTTDTVAGKGMMDEEKINALYKKLCWLMENEHLYTETQLTRERMAERLNTNRTYLTHVIKEKTGMNYLQFVNSYRINEAIRILSDKNKSTYPLKQIWSDLGFSSPTTFYKLFQQAVGITPSTYRKQFLEVSETELEK